VADESFQLELVSVGGSGVEDQAVPLHILIRALKPDAEVTLTARSKAEMEAIRIVQHRQEFQNLGLRGKYSGSRDITCWGDPIVEGVLVQGPRTIRQQRSGVERGLAKELDTRRDDRHNGAAGKRFHGAVLEGTGV